jgi:hypothetical protein
LNKLEVQVIAGSIVNMDPLQNYFARKRDGWYEIEAKEKRAKRSLGQNAYFHGVMLPIVLDGLRDAGWDEIEDLDDAKDLVKDMFARFNLVNNKTGEMVTRIKPTHKMSTVEFIEFCDKIIKWGAEWLGIQIPYPNEYLKEF